MSGCLYFGISGRCGVRRFFGDRSVGYVFVSNGEVRLLMIRYPSAVAALQVSYSVKLGVFSHCIR